MRSNGTVTYVGKDIAYQLWKFGLLGKDFFYRPLLRYTDGRELWVSTDRPSDSSVAFGQGGMVYNVIDVRQSYLQDVVVAGLRYGDRSFTTLDLACLAGVLLGLLLWLSLDNPVFAVWAATVVIVFPPAFGFS